MKRKQLFFIVITAALLLTSCAFQEQVRSYNEIMSPAANGNVSATLARMDSVKKFRHPLVNLKYQQQKKNYEARFVTKTEKAKSFSENQVIQDICTIYQDYWTMKLIDAPLNCDSILYNNLTHYLVDNKLTSFSFDELSKTIRDDSELSKVIEKEGFYSHFLLINGIQDVLIWDEQTLQKYSVELPEETIDVDVIFIENYITQGVTDFASFGSSQIGGWASKEDSSLFCNRGSYRLKSEKFQYSYLKHESLHFIDLAKYHNLASADLEYRAKLIELIYCSKKTIYHRLDEFILNASNATREHAHPYANYHLTHQLSKKLFEKDFESDQAKWKSLTPEAINAASLELFLMGSELLNEDPNRSRVIEDIDQLH